MFNFDIEFDDSQFDINSIIDDGIYQAGLELMGHRPKDRISIEGDKIAIETQPPQAIEEVSPGRLFIKFEPIVKAEEEYFNIQLDDDIDKSLNTAFGG